MAKNDEYMQTERELWDRARGLMDGGWPADRYLNDADGACSGQDYLITVRSEVIRNNLEQTIRHHGPIIAGLRAAGWNGEGKLIFEVRK